MCTQLRIPAVYMRGGTSKGVFFLADDLPSDPTLRDPLLLRVIGSPDPYGRQIDGLGGATSSTSKVVILSRSSRADCDVDYLFGAVAVDRPLIDWSGNCGNLSAAVGPFAISSGLVDQVPADGLATVRIWQANIARKIVARVPMRAGEVQETGEFWLDGVAFPAAEIRLEFLEPAAAPESGMPSPNAMFPTGQPIDRLKVPGLGTLEATLINAGNPTVFVDAQVLGLSGHELPGDLNGRTELLTLAETVRAWGAVAMGLADSPALATAHRPHTPKLAFVARASDTQTSDGRHVPATAIDLLARIFSMGQLHHAMTGTGAVAIAAAAAIPGTVVSRLAPVGGDGRIRLGHPSGALTVGAETELQGGQWVVRKVLMSRSARRLMEGWVRVPCA